jgi:hypothetical protein
MLAILYFFVLLGQTAPMNVILRVKLRVLPRPGQVAQASSPHPPRPAAPRLFGTGSSNDLAISLI